MSNELDIEAKLIESKDNLQIQYLQDYTYTKNEVIIIDNTPLALSLQKYLVKVGFQNIYLCKTVREGLEIFTKFVKRGKLIPIILNDSIDKNLRGVVEEILDIDSSANIIVETASEKSESIIKDLFNLGIFDLINKPIRFKDVEELAKTLESEHSVNKNEVADLENKINFAFQNTKRISIKQVSEVVNKEITTMEEYFKNLEIESKVMSLGITNELACKQCNSVRISQVAKCPQCKAMEFKQQNLVEHYKCGEVYPKPSELDKCPKCNKKIGNLGKDYGELDNYYVCSACNDKFPEPEYEFECRNCENKFEKHQATWIKNMNYKIIK